MHNIGTYTGHAIKFNTDLIERSPGKFRTHKQASANVNWLGFTSQGKVVAHLDPSPNPYGQGL